MLAILGTRQQELLKLLLRSKGGLTVVELSERLGITANAVRQHLVTLENEGLVTPGESRPSGGRPEQLYVLTPAGKELFPRHYSWFAQLMVESIKQDEPEGRQQRVEKLAKIMEELGYETRKVDVENGEPVIEANNCVFHKLAMAAPDICAFDLALLSTFTGSAVEHQECMAKGGNVCRFRFSPKDD